MFEQLTIQTYVKGRWYDALVLTVENPADVESSLCWVTYVDDYLSLFVDQRGCLLETSVSVNLGLNWALRRSTGYPAFILDIIPAGAARRCLKMHAEKLKPLGMELDFFLLQRFTAAPIGHMRVKESLEGLDRRAAIAFPRSEIIQRSDRFLEYAAEAGAAISAGTGAQGEAPKLLVSEDWTGALHLDALLPDDQVRRHWLVKFSRNDVSERDKNILRAEYQYYRAIETLGLNTVSTEGLALEEAESPSLWMPRFDRKVRADGRIERLAVESLYSVCGNSIPGSYMRHEDVLRRLLLLWRENQQADEMEELACEYLRRDLLNRILGNSDNHGRNTSILRHDGRLQLAPIYDLAPMVMDFEGITRTTKWARERMGAPDWSAACASLAEILDPDRLFARLRAAAHEFRALPELLKEMPEEVRRSPSIPLNNLDARLKEWGLL